MTASQNLRAAAFMVAAVAFFAINDVFVKLLSEHLPIGQIMGVRGLAVMALMVVLLPRLGLPLGRPDKVALLRGLSEVTVTATFLSALKFLPIADTYTLYFAAPILLTAAAALVLGEHVGPRRWIAVGVGFAGVLVALGAPASWTAPALLAVAAACLSVVRDILTRKVPPHVGSGTVALATAGAVTLGGFTTLPFGWEPIGWGQLLLLLLAAFGAMGGYLGFVTALRMGDVGFVAAFRYSAIPITMLLGLLVWGDLPGLRMATGAAVIVASGLYILAGERKRARG